MEDTIYFNVPIQLINGFFTNKIKVLVDVISYACYDKCRKHNIPIEDALNYFDLEIFLNKKESLYNKGEILFNSIPTNSPKTGINKMKLEEFVENNKSEFEIACFIAFLAIRSVLQKKTYQKIDNNYLLSRMDGKACSVNYIDELSDPIKKFANHYQLVKIKDALSLYWGLKHYSRHTRGFYVSFKMKLEDLIDQAELKRESYQKKELKKKKKAVVKMVLDRMNQSK